ncbi:4-carboxymuconolactone decarboxylase [Micromonospora sp. NBC_01813]|uniref:4-carboxymuconolactone decarboxylase n=1 Tax=Micromonospora sp. NBC_01813 TaxID=2975988 RepID=UPI002DDA305C|nr:4-carboxymuconolactone decarboxylase [Micromonospora sp. NBC_01813]WSA11723.1 4-carboxymuconolactone decarboxylase [Micromonospora sp. NBC_01813]
MPTDPTSGDVPASTADGTPPADPTHAAGMAVRRAVLGDAHVDRAVANTTEFTADFQDFITRYAWGSVWTRDGLDRRTRSCVTLAVLTALHCTDELAMHVRAALRNGLTAQEINEVLLHTAVYAGVPAANSAYAVAQRVLAESPDLGSQMPDSPTASSADHGAVEPD